MSAFLFEKSNPTLAYEKAKSKGKILVSEETFREFSEGFVQKKFDEFVSLHTRLEIINAFAKKALFLEMAETITACRDPKDNKFLELAVSANASCIITGDKDLLILHP